MNDVKITHEIDVVVSDLWVHIWTVSQCPSFLIFQVFKIELLVLRNDIGESIYPVRHATS